MDTTGTDFWHIKWPILKYQGIKECVTPNPRPTSPFQFHQDRQLTHHVSTWPDASIKAYGAQLNHIGIWQPLFYIYIYILVNFGNNTIVSQITISQHYHDSLKKRLKFIISGHQCKISWEIRWNFGGRNSSQMGWTSAVQSVCEMQV